MLPDQSIESLDERTLVVYLEVPGPKVVLLQGLFETYEGVATVRTLDIRKSLVCLLTTPSLLDECLAVLEDVKPQIAWRFAGRPSDEDCEKYLGYQRKK